MRDIDYLKLLSEKYRSESSVQAEIINRKALLSLPKGNEYFFSDIHGEYEGFRYLLRSCAGVVRSKVDETFGSLMKESDQIELSRLIAYPKKVLAKKKAGGELDEDWYRTTISQLIAICRVVGVKHTRARVREMLPKEFAHAIDELYHVNESDENKRLYYRGIIDSVIAVGAGDAFVTALSDLIQNLLMNHLHIIGDIFDRGPRADIVMDDIMNFPYVDIQWGNHDISWMGAVSGNEACIASVLRIATSYNCFDVLEDGYGINLRSLSQFASEVYADDNCDAFKPHLLDKNKYDKVDYDLAAKMCKAITIIQLKLEGMLIKKHPEYNLSDRLLLDKIDFDKGVVKIDGKEYPMNDINLPTVDRENPYELSKGEAELMRTIKYSFKHSEKLNNHIRYIYTHGSLYLIRNNNLLFHGCIPMTKKGEFMELVTKDGAFSGKNLMDYLTRKINEAYFLEDTDERKQDAVDMMWYLWCGPVSPLFGKDKITTFEHVFLSDNELMKEPYNPYYSLSHEEKYADKIFDEFGINPDKGHIINGHVPVKVSKGERPVKANGKLYVIDGGMSKAYHNTTGIAGYTLIFNSHHLALGAHKPYVKGEENVADIEITEVMKHRLLVEDTDEGAEIKKFIEDLNELLEAYRNGIIKEK
ncbi:fructose-1,6-bisphosphatase [Eubacterium ruminantium]|uniref:fructose-1,6-bisphosphatase n=1 Tax=Eubacterium ruminantium TaxID=42322 RepID=UPI0015681EE0|nr:fructose-1,6-bisphosphatase [Eubacterium ruminantium]